MPKISAINPLLSWLMTDHQVSELVALIEAKQAELKKQAQTTQPLTKWLAFFPSPLIELWPLFFTNFPSDHKISALELFDQLDSLLKTITTLPTATLTLAFTPTSQQIHQYISTLRAHLNESLLLKVVVDERIIGGAQLSYQGKNFSSTLKDRLEYL